MTTTMKTKTTSKTEPPKLIYVIENLSGRRPYVQVYQLDHESRHCLFLKERSGVIRITKMGRTWCTSKKEVADRVRSYLDRKIEMLKSQLAELEGITEISLRQVPPEAPVESDKLKV